MFWKLRSKFFGLHTWPNTARLPLHTHVTWPSPHTWLVVGSSHSPSAKICSLELSLSHTPVFHSTGLLEKAKIGYLNGKVPPNPSSFSLVGWTLSYHFSKLPSPSCLRTSPERKVPLQGRPALPLRNSFLHEKVLCRIDLKFLSL